MVIETLRVEEIIHRRKRNRNQVKSEPQEMLLRGNQVRKT